MSSSLYSIYIFSPRLLTSYWYSSVCVDMQIDLCHLKETTGIARKYIGALDIPMSLLAGRRTAAVPSHQRTGHPATIGYIAQEPWQGVRGMLQHRSQLVW